MKWFDNLCIRLWVRLEMLMFDMRKQVEAAQKEREKR